MSRYFILLLFTLLPWCAWAQAPNRAAEQLMSRRVLSYDDVSYNVALLIPKLYAEHKKDTIDILVDYYVKNFAMTDPVACFVIIRDIGNHSFKGRIRPWLTTDTTKKLSDSSYYQLYILSYYFQWYLDNHNIGKDGTYREDLRNAYGQYFIFIKKLAKETLEEPGLSEDEQFILRFYANPSDSLYQLLERPEYAGSPLNNAWLRLKKERELRSGTDLAVFGGLWIPNGNLAVLGNHPYVGFLVGSKKNRHSFNIRMDFQFLNTPTNYLVKIDTTLYATNSFFGLNMGLDYAYHFWGTKGIQVNAVGGIAWEVFDAGLSEHYSADSKDNGFNTLNLNVGISCKVFVKHKVTRDHVKDSYLGLTGKYNFLFFNNSGGTDLSGNVVTVGLVYGAHTRKVSHYYISN